MNVSLDLEATNHRTAIRRSQSWSECGLDCKEELFGNLADRSQLSILQTLCEGAKTETQIASATNLSGRDVAFSLERLLSCGCITQKNVEDPIFFGLSAPWLLRLEGIVDEMLMAALKGHRAPLNRN